MGLDLYALQKTDNFKEEELALVILRKRQMESNLARFDVFLENLIKEKFNQELNDFFENQPQETIDEFFESAPEVIKEKTSLGVDEYLDELNHGETTSIVLNYYFNNCTETYWNDIHLIEDESLIRGSFSPEETDGSLKELLDEHQLLHPAQVDDALAIIRNRKYITKKTIKMIAFLEHFKSETCVFAFI